MQYCIFYDHSLAVVLLVPMLINFLGPFRHLNSPVQASYTLHGSEKYHRQFTCSGECFPNHVNSKKNLYV